MCPRRRPPDPWPWPHDNPLRRRETIAHGYREALHEADPATAELIDARCVEWGQTWVLTGRRALHHHELLTTEQVAEHFDVTPRTVDQWRYRDGLACRDTPDGIRYLYGEVVEFRRRQIQARHR